MLFKIVARFVAIQRFAPHQLQLSAYYTPTSRRFLPEETLFLYFYIERILGKLKGFYKKLLTFFILSQSAVFFKVLSNLIALSVIIITCPQKENPTRTFVRLGFLMVHPTGVCASLSELFYNKVRKASRRLALARTAGSHRFGLYTNAANTQKHVRRIWYTRQESNLRKTRLRRAVLYPLSYGCK